MSAVAALIAATLNAGTPLLIAGIGILIHEKSGVLNLGIEGIMLMGAVAGFGVTFATGSFMLGFIAGGLVGVLLAAVFGFFTLGLYANQNAAGLAMAISGRGLPPLPVSLCRACRCPRALRPEFPFWRIFPSSVKPSFPAISASISR